MYNQYILIKAKSNILSPELNDFFIGLLGNNIKIEDNNGLLTIYHSYENTDDIYDTLAGLTQEYDQNVYAYISRKDFNEDNYNIISNYFIETDLKTNLYKEHELLMELVLEGKREGLDHIALGSFYQTPSMIETLKAFLENDMNTSKTANAIYMHRNTLINKLDRFVSQTGYDIKKFSDAFIIYHLIKK
ncbi:MAG: helix-turn-helix domain-containing protein [Acholeplasmatales bacterium]|nr:helix-turn-helix domain-containing protein [Acholeplasmatales bacterium]